jgi:hypothetical protein
MAFKPGNQEWRKRKRNGGGRPKLIGGVNYVPGKSVDDRKSIDDAEDEKNKMLLGIATQSEIDWFRQKTYEMKRDLAIRRQQNRKKMSEREANFWKNQNEEK